MAGQLSQALVLLPGMNCSPRMWSGVATTLATDRPDIEIIRPELDCCSIDGCVTALLDTLPARFALAGLSLGAVVAMAVVRQAPERVSRLCLLSANPHAPTAEQIAAWERSRSELARGRSARDLQRDLLPVLLHPDARTADVEQRVLAMADEVGTQVLDRQLAAQASRVDERAALSRVSVPTLIIAAAGDALCPLGKHEEMHALVPASSLMVLDGAGHLSPVEAAERVANGMQAWLAGEPTPR